MQARALVGAVFAPHHAEDAQFGVARLTAQDLNDLVVLRLGQLMGGDQLGRESRHACASAETMERNISRPSVEPMSGSEARSGCGIMPITLRCRIQHAGDIARRSVRVIEIAEHHAVVGFEFIEGALIRDVAALAVSDRHTQHLAACGRRREGRIGGFGPKRALRGKRISDPRCAPVHPEQARPRPESETRCKCPAPGRRQRRSASPPASPERTWRSLRSAGNRRKRIRRAG